MIAHGAVETMTLGATAVGTKSLCCNKALKCNREALEIERQHSKKIKTIITI